MKLSDKVRLWVLIGIVVACAASWWWHKTTPALLPLFMDPDNRQTRLRPDMNRVCADVMSARNDACDPDNVDEKNCPLLRSAVTTCEQQMTEAYDRINRECKHEIYNFAACAIAVDPEDGPASEAILAECGDEAEARSTCQRGVLKDYVEAVSVAG